MPEATTDTGSTITDTGGATATTTDAASAGWSAPASQAELDRIISDRLTRERAKYAGFDDIKAKADQFDALAAASKTDAERAADDARRDERAKVTTEATPRVVRAEFRAAAKGVLNDTQLAALLEDRDLLKYADNAGEPDVEKIAKLVTAFAPKDDGDKREFPDLGGGRRGGSAKTTDMNQLIRDRAAGR